MSLSDFFFERETEYFGATPFQLLDQIGAILVEQVIGVQDEVSQSLSEGLERHLSAAQINHGVERWAGAVEGAFGKSFELFESYVIKNVLSLPPSFGTPTVTIAHSDLNLQETVNRLAEAKRRATQLHAEEVQLLAEEQVLSQLESTGNLLASILRQHDLDGLAMATSSLAQQIQTLQAICQDTMEASSNIQCVEEGETIISYQLALDAPHRKQESLRLIQAELARLLTIGSIDEIPKALSKLVK